MADKFDCDARALPGEIKFTLLSRDPDFAYLVNLWAARRERDIDCGDRPETDREQVREARAKAVAAPLWRKEHLYEWRKPKPELADD